MQALDLDTPFEVQTLNAVDAKGRVSVPSSVRDLIADRCRLFAPPGVTLNPNNLSLSTGEDDQIRCYDAIGISQRTRALRAAVVDLPAAEQARALARAGKRESGNAVTFDSVGRMVLPEMLREFAGITDQALFWGTVDYFEIWNPQRALVAWADEPDMLRKLNWILNKQGKGAAK